MCSCNTSLDVYYIYHLEQHFRIGLYSLKTLRSFLLVCCLLLMVVVFSFCLLRCFLGAYQRLPVVGYLLLSSKSIFIPPLLRFIHVLTPPLLLSLLPHLTNCPLFPGTLSTQPCDVSCLLLPREDNRLIWHQLPVKLRASLSTAAASVSISVSLAIPYPLMHRLRP